MSRTIRRTKPRHNQRRSNFLHNDLLDDSVVNSTRSIDVFWVEYRLKKLGVNTVEQANARIKAAFHGDNHSRHYNYCWEHRHFCYNAFRKHCKALLEKAVREDCYDDLSMPPFHGYKMWD